MLNIVIPMAGRGSRFAQTGYTEPKPLIPIHGQRMIELVIKNLTPSQPHRFIFLCLQEHLDKYDLEVFFKNMLGERAVIVPVNQVTEGAACTVLLAKHYIDNDDQLMIANSDQWIDFDIDDYFAIAEQYDDFIMTMTANDPKWSFVRLDQNNHVVEVVEKQVISNEATVGIYNFQHGKDFVRAAEQMIVKNLQVNGEFYVAPTYNQLIEEGHRVGIYNVGVEANGMYGLGTPTDLELFLSLPASQRAVKKGWL